MDTIMQGAAGGGAGATTTAPVAGAAVPSVSGIPAVDSDTNMLADATLATDDTDMPADEPVPTTAGAVAGAAPPAEGGAANPQSSSAVVARGIAGSPALLDPGPGGGPSRGLSTSVGAGAGAGAGDGAGAGADTASLPPVATNSMLVDMAATTPRLRCSEESAELRRGKRGLREFLAKHTCYNMLPASTKVVVFEREVGLKLAFYALVEHGVKAAPVWDGLGYCYCGVLTMSDFMLVMLHYFERGRPEAAMDEHSCFGWRETIAPQLAVKGMSSVSPKISLLGAMAQLFQHHVSALPVLADDDSSNVLGFVTPKTILDFVVSNHREGVGPMFSKSARELGIGIWEHDVCVPLSMPLHKVFSKLLSSHLPAVPVVREDGRVVDVFHRGDTSYLVFDRNLAKLSLPIADVRAAQLRDGVPFFESLHVCPATASLKQVIDTFATTRGRTLTLVDPYGRFVGFIYIRALLKFFATADGLVPPLLASDGAAEPAAATASVPTAGASAAASPAPAPALAPGSVPAQPPTVPATSASASVAVPPAVPPPHNHPTPAPSSNDPPSEDTPMT